LKGGLSNCGGGFDVDSKQKRVEELNQVTAQPDFWNDAEKAQTVLKEQSALKGVLANWEKHQADLEEARFFLDVARDEKSEDALDRGLAASRQLQRLLPDQSLHAYKAASMQQKLAALYRGRGRTPEAIELLRSAIQSQRQWVVDHPKSVTSLMHSLSDLAGLISTRDFDEADQLLAEAVELGEAQVRADNRSAPAESGDTVEFALAKVLEARADIREGRGRVVEQETMLRRAIAVLDAQLAEYPDLPMARREWVRAQVKLGRILVAAGRRDDAELAYRTVCRLPLTSYPRDSWPELSTAFEQLVSLLARKGRSDDEELGATYREFIALLGRLIDAEPRNTANRNRRARANFALRRFSDALEDIAAAVELRPDDHSTLMWILPEMVAACPDESFRAGILALADKAIERTKGNGMAYFNRGRLHYAMRHFEEAQIDFAKWIELVNPKDSSAYNNLAWLLATSPQAGFRDPPRAVELAEKAVAGAPIAANWNTLGVARYRNGDWAGARDALQRSMELGSGGISFNWFFLAMTHWQLGNKEEAGQWYDKAVQWMEKNQPQDEELQRFRAEAAELLGVTNTQPKPESK
jgi:tetratricopeptide (TPR) repeat protein